MSLALPRAMKRVGKGLRHAVTPPPPHPKDFPSPFALVSPDLCSSGHHIRRLPLIILGLIYASPASLRLFTSIVKPELQTLAW